MKDLRKKFPLTKENILEFILIASLTVINHLTEMKVYWRWIKDIDVWINDFYVNTFVFMLMSTLLSRIKNQYLNYLISYVASVIVGNFVYLDSSNLQITPKVLLLTALSVLALIFWGIAGYNQGKRKGHQQVAAEIRAYAEMVKNLDNETRSRLYNLKKFIKKHPKECEMIDRFGIDHVLEFIEDDKIIRKGSKNDPTSEREN